ncbi:MAG: TerC family protein [Hyphomicrobiales bacterium]
MPFDSEFSSIIIPAQIVAVDLLLGGDNAVVIALVCRRLRPHLLARAVLLGTFAAIVFRLFLTTMASTLIEMPYLNLAGAVVLVAIAVNLFVPKDPMTDPGAPGSGTAPFMGLWPSVALIFLADAIMSLDNIVALAAIAKGNLIYLGAGLALSIPMIIYGGTILTTLINGYPILVMAGAALLGWVAGDLAVSDVAISGWVASQAPALPLVVPLLCAIFVVAEGQMLTRRRGGAPRNDMRAIAPPRVLFPAPMSVPRPVEHSLVQTGPSLAQVRAHGRSPETAPSGGSSARQASGDDAAPGAVSHARADLEGGDDKLVLAGLLIMFVLAGLMVVWALSAGGGMLNARG